MRTRSLMLGCVLALGLVLVGWALGLVDLGSVSPAPSGLRPGLQAGGGTPETPTPKPTEPSECPTALLEGVLVMDPHRGLAVSTGPDSAMAVQWPPTYSTRVNGVHVLLLDGSGVEVARTGDRVSMGGGVGPGPGEVFVVCPWSVARIDPASSR